MKKTQPTSEDETINYVQELLERALDARDGYKQAAELTDSPGLRQFFTENSGQRAVFALELEALLHEVGVEPVDSKSLAAKVHHGWMAIVSKIGQGEENLLNECQRGEEAALSDYEEALESRELPLKIAVVVEGQRDRLKSELFTLNELTQARREAA